MEYKIFINNPWQENTVVLYDGTGEAVVIDCGCFTREEGKRLQDFLTEKGLKPVALLNTHLHPDHVFGNRFMLDAYGLAAQASQEDEFCWNMPWSMPPCSGCGARRLLRHWEDT